MPTLNKKAFDTKLSALKNVIAQIAVQQHTVSIANVDKVRALTNQFTKLSNDFEKYTLTDVQQRELKAVRETYPREVRSPLNKKLTQLEKDKDKASQKIEAEAQKRSKINTEAKSTVQSLLPQVREAADKCLHANTTNMSELHGKYKVLAEQLRKAIDLLDPEERLIQIKQQVAISEQINRYREQLDAQDRKAYQAIGEAIQKASKNVSSMTVEEMLLGLIGGSAKQELLTLFSKTDEVMLLENGSDEEQVKQVGALVLADLPKTSQGALVRILLSQLAKADSQSQSGPLAQFVKAMEKDINGLLSGEKTHLSIMYEVNGVIGSIHIDVLDLINDSQRVLQSVFYNMYKQGVQNQNIVMSLTAPTEVAALLQLQGFDMQNVPQIENLQELTGQVIKYSAHPQALSVIMRNDVSESDLTSGLKSTMRQLLLRAQERPGLQPGQVLTFIQSMATMLETRNLLISTPTAQKDLGLSVELKSITGNVGKRDVGAIQYVQTSPIQTTPTLDSTPLVELPTSTPVVNVVTSDKPKSEKVESPVTQPGDKDSVSVTSTVSDKLKTTDKEQKQTKEKTEPKLDLSKEYIEFTQSLHALSEIYIKLEKKGRNGDKTYQETADKVLDAMTAIRTSGEDFFKKPNKDTLKTFTEVTNTQISTLEPVLKEHRGNSFVRGIWAAFKGLIGVLAALTVIPALIVEASTTKGYAGTFFSTPETDSAKAFKPVKEGLVHQEIDIETKIIGPGGSK